MSGFILELDNRCVLYHSFAFGGFFFILFFNTVIYINQVKLKQVPHTLSHHWKIPFQLKQRKTKLPSLPEAAVYSHHKLHFFLKSRGISVYELQNPMRWNGSEFWGTRENHFEITILSQCKWALETPINEDSWEECSKFCLNIFFCIYLLIFKGKGYYNSLNIIIVII